MKYQQFALILSYLFLIILGFSVYSSPYDRFILGKATVSKAFFVLSMGILSAMFSSFIVIGYIKYKNAMREGRKILRYSWLGGHGTQYSVLLGREDYLNVVLLHVATLNLSLLIIYNFFYIATIQNLNLEARGYFGLLFIAFLWLIFPLIFLLLGFIYVAYRYSKNTRDVSSS